ncbi:threonine aldolase family protein [Actinomadura welshii]|uniref:threonine aldolase family protein n=1 Tax=Actinomadura welshii TaxID=3103817 RepID=UPI000526F9AF|nr:GntG family PLP-dependent aldolase [Actinomadura madurae]
MRTTLKPIDLRSDTVTLPTEDMRKAMYQAEVGDDGRLLPDGRHGDPTVAELEEHAARLLEKPAALFMASGTMANLTALRTWCPRGAAVAVGRTSHLYRREVSAFDDGYFGLRPVELPDPDGLPGADAVRLALRRHDPAMLCLENTHNAAGGTAWTPRQGASIHEVTSAAGVPVHLDGARLFNAAVALAVPPGALAAPADSLMFCLTKGLGAPMGAVLLGEAGFIARAREVRRLLGGQMRQVGVVAAAGLVALRDFRERLALDHERARGLAERLADLRGARVDPGRVRTNIVQMLLPDGGPPLRTVQDELARQGVLVHSTGARTVRLVTHRDLSDDDIVHAADVLHTVLGRTYQDGSQQQ